MKITKGKIILAVIVVYFSIMGVKNINKQKSTNADLLKKVTVVSDGKINPENNGKLVLVCGKANFDDKVYFDELYEPLNTFKARRIVKDFVAYEDNGKTRHEWRDRPEPKQTFSYDFLDTLNTTDKITRTKVGDFALDEQGMSLVPLNDHFKGQEEICGLKWVGLYYGDPAHGDEEEVGDVSLEYKFFNVEKSPYLSVLAEQSGNTFKPYSYNSKTSVYKVFPDQIDSVEKLKDALADQVKNDSKGKFLFILLIVAVGVLLIVDSNKNKAKKAATAENTETEKEEPESN